MYSTGPETLIPTENVYPGYAHLQSPQSYNIRETGLSLPKSIIQPLNTHTAAKILVQEHPQSTQTSSYTPQMTNQQHPVKHSLTGGPLVTPLNAETLARSAQSQSFMPSQRTPTAEAPEAVDDDDQDDVEFVLEPTPGHSEADNESVAAFSTKSDLYSVTSQDHKGNGVACRYYNRTGCTKGSSCPFSHAPDQYSLRSHPDGRNVCLYFIHHNKCRFTDQQCNYSHDRDDLSWSDEELKMQLEQAISRRKKEVVKLLAREKAVGMLSERKNARLQGHYVSQPPPTVHIPSRMPVNLRFPDVQTAWLSIMARRVIEAGLSQTELMGLVSIGLKPWDARAWEMLRYPGCN